MTNIGLLKNHFKKDIFNIIIDYTYSKKHRKRITKEIREKRQLRHLKKLQRSYDRRDDMIERTVERMEKYEKELDRFNKEITSTYKDFIDKKIKYLNSTIKHYDGSNMTYDQKLYNFNVKFSLSREILNWYNIYRSNKSNSFMFMLNVKIMNLDIYSAIFYFEPNPLFPLYYRIKNSNKIRKYGKRDILKLQKIVKYNFKN